MSSIVLTLAILVVVVFATLRARAANPPPDLAEIKEILRARIASAGDGVGIVVGIVDSDGRRIISEERMSAEDTRPVDGDTVFEIGSVSKVFTALALANMVQRGEVKLDDPISVFLPKTVKAPGFMGKEITLLDLATHTSGLPRLPDNLDPKDPANPYADYTREQLYNFLSHFELTREIGSKYEYSNLGAGLLGHLLALKAGTNYEALVRTRVWAPLGMTDTVVALTPALKARLATGHDQSGRAVANWDLPVLAGAGGIRSTANDLLKFLAASMSLVHTPLSSAMGLTRIPRRDTDSPTMRVALGWCVSEVKDSEIIWHNGATGGYHAFVGFTRDNTRGVVVLANTVNSIDDIGFHLIEPKYELAAATPKSKHTAIPQPADVLDRVVGQYRLAPGIFLNVRRDKGQMFVQLTGQSYLEIFPESETDFFLEVVDAQLTFKKDGAGKVTAVVLHQNGLDQTAQKISDEPPKERQSIALDPKIYDTYAGEYQLQPGIFFTIRRTGDKLMARLTGQTFLEVFPESRTEFFYKVVDAQLTFVTNASGSPTALILHQNGIDQRAEKTK